MRLGTNGVRGPLRECPGDYTWSHGVVGGTGDKEHMSTPATRRLDAIIEALELPEMIRSRTFTESIDHLMATDSLLPHTRVVVAIMACTGSYPKESDVARLTPIVAVGSHDQAVKFLKGITRKASRKSRKREPQIFSGTVIDVSRSSRALSITGIPRVAMALSAQGAKLGAKSVVWEGGAPGGVSITPDGGWSLEPDVWAGSFRKRTWLLSLKNTFWRTMNLVASLPYGHSLVRMLRTLVSPLANTMFDRSGPRSLLIMANCHYIAPEVPRPDIVTRVLTWAKVNPRLRTTVVLHDLLPILDAKNFAPDQSLEHIEFMRFIASCSTVIAPSPHLIEQIDAVRILFDPHPQARTVVAPFGLATHSKIQSSTPATTTASDANPTFLMIGSMDDRKNHALAFWALGLMGQGHAGQPGIPSTLHVVGARRPTSNNTRDALTFARANNVTVIEHHGASDAMVHELMHCSLATLYLSWSEGFGLPILESLAQGVPVVASDIPPHRAHEQYGGIVFTPPNDPLALTKLLTTMTQTPQYVDLLTETINADAMPSEPALWADIVLNSASAATTNSALTRDFAGVHTS